MGGEYKNSIVQLTWFLPNAQNKAGQTFQRNLTSSRWLVDNCLGLLDLEGHSWQVFWRILEQQRLQFVGHLSRFAVGQCQSIKGINKTKKNSLDQRKNPKCGGFLCIFFTEAFLLFLAPVVSSNPAGLISLNSFLCNMYLINEHLLHEYFVRQCVGQSKKGKKVNIKIK